MSANKYCGFLQALKSLCENDKICREACSTMMRLRVLRDTDVENLMGILASLLLSQHQTLVVAEHFTDTLPQILAIALSDNISGSHILQDVSSKLLHEKRCVALGKLAQVHPDAMLFSLKYFSNHPSPFFYWTLLETDEEPKAKKRKINTTPISEEEIAVCCFSLLRLKTDHFRQLWDWSQFLHGFLNHKEAYVRWLACQCCALLLNMGSSEKQTLLHLKLTIDEIDEFSVKHSADERRIGEKFSKTCGGSSSSGTIPSLPQNGSKAVVSVSGITLPVHSEVEANFRSNLVLVNSTQSNLQAIALGIATGKSLCLQGPVGCGKTALVEYLAKLTGRGVPPDFLVVQLGDQTDSKMLLGTYQCTDIPGEFVWKPGVLTQAVLGGYWLLLEDIDSCTTDVAAVLTSLLETGSLSVPGFKDCVHAAPGFQLFFTQRLVTGLSGLHKNHTSVTSMLQRHWLSVQMEPLSQSELVEVVRTLHPSLNTVASRMVDVFLLFSAGSHHMALGEFEGSSDNKQRNTVRIQSAGARLPSTRDLIKWCHRSSQAFDVCSPESGLKLYQDAIDIFCCNVSDQGHRLSLAESIAAKLGIIHTKAEYFCNVHKPIISATSSNIVAGRINLPRRQADVTLFKTSVKSTFSFTRPASALLERIASCIYHSEPVLLVGETGVGKTSSIQYLAGQMGQSLSVINMNQQSDSADLLGGYKPVELKFVISPLRDEFETLFRQFFSVEENAKFLSHIAQCFTLKKWSTLLTLMKHSTTAALKRFEKKQKSPKSESLFNPALKKNWLRISVKLQKVQEQLKKSQNALAFAFVEGTLVRALQKGQWVLLDEINLASAQTLECLSSLLEGSSGSLYLLERGDEQSIKRHPNFRIFAAMNPATDVGKKELPPGIRNRFTEFFVDELVDRQDLMLLCGSYLSNLALPASKLEALVRFYLNVCKEAESSLSDGTGHKPHYSLRTLCRALSVAATNPCGSVPRSLYEGILLSFLTQLDRSSHPIVEEMVARAVIGKTSSDPKSLVKQPIPVPMISGKTFVQVEGYWVTQGSLEPNTPDKYIMTKTVRQNLRDLVRVVSLAKLPVLLQGETSVGKTSLITYLAHVSGNRCLRINNHEHTDLQEYIGCYAADEHGKLVFKEGVLVEAMRFGHWVILDELNLAPSDVLEALNRVLDDNRELFIPETQVVVKAHPNFMLFATQNPPGLYGGRKVLSRAFRNRFIELHFDEIPSLELETIMHLRCDMPPSYSKKMVAVMSDLQMRRKGSAAFAGKQGFITLRDLFRWGERYRLAHQAVQGKYYDWDQHIADEGYLILAGRVRKDEERLIIQESLLKHIKRPVSSEKLFTLNAETSPVTRGILETIVQQTPTGFSHIVWTYNMRRLAVLLGKACEFKEPILLVGETGCGKTTLCQLLAATKNQELSSVNCHMHSESADFLGGLRPVRERTEENLGKLFEWVDGPLIEAMHNGGVFLADEISLADDSVLERLNSLLEPERKLLLTEKGSGVGGEPCEVTAKDGFIFVGTMNPGGDYGKKELSPALRNRFTEIWCEGCTQRSDLIAVIEHNLKAGRVFQNSNTSATVGSSLVDFLDWFSQTELGNRFARSIRDIMTWVNFINVCTEATDHLDLSAAYIHGACLTFLDSLGTGLTSFTTREAVYCLRVAALEFLRNQVKVATGKETVSLKSFLALESDDIEVLSTSEKFGIKPFYVAKGCTNTTEDAEFLLSAPTTRINAMRVLRGLQLGKALLLEGSPGVGKTSLVAALARAAGYKLTRINLSDQTDISDLFGADLPVEGGAGGEFAWRDGPFLQALRAGHWILLDELNLASQSVLEGLNAVLDHRGDLFIPELGRTFHIEHGRTRLFACQNPLNQGGARKGLPQSFLNRFTQVYMETLTSSDLEYICQALFPTLSVELIKSMVLFNQYAAAETSPGGKWGQRGAPWEMNLRDLSRWCEITVWGASNGVLNPGRFVQLMYMDRMRTARDKEEMAALYRKSFSDRYPLSCGIPQMHVTPSTLYIGDVELRRGSLESISAPKLVLRYQLPMLQSLARCVSMGWMSILVGPAGCGKTSLVHLLAQLAGQELRTLAVNSAMDTTEILGGFEQADYKRHFDELKVQVQKVMRQGVQHLILLGKEKESKHLLSLWETFLQSEVYHKEVISMDSEVKLFIHKIDLLLGVLAALLKVSVSPQNMEEVEILKEKLTLLKDCSTRDSSLNAGGKFEWVDSILIKSLTDGCWLLVDNVNLCSAAVLDRLNGLLEPQGVLTVSERGVNSNGELITIRPHPNFRLFLAMDPKHGEISRAMRNRGVEIFVATSEGDMTTWLSSLDLNALLYETGIRNHQDQELLLHVHESMINVIQGADTPGLSELLHASFLFVQQVQRGMAPIPSLLSSFTKVYIQSRLGDSIDTKRRYLSILEEAVDQGSQKITSHALDRLVSECTLKTKEIHLDSCLATVKQRCALLSALADAEDGDLANICKLLGINDGKMDFQMMLINQVILYFQTCSVADVNVAYKWLLNEIQGSRHATLISEMSEKLYNALLNVDDLANCHLIWDRRWLPDVAAAIAVLSGVDDQGVENRVTLLLYVTAHLMKSKFSPNFTTIKKRKNISVLEYSHAVAEGVLADALSSEPIFLEIGPFLDMAFSILNDSLNTFGVVISDELWWSVRRAFTWTQRFQKQAAALNLSSDKNSMEETQNLLAVHYRWFSKHAIPVVLHLARLAVLDTTTFEGIIERMDASVFSNNSVIWHVTKRLRSAMRPPLPIASELQARLTLKASHICSVLNLWNSEDIHKNLSQVVHFLSTAEGTRARACLIVAIKDLLVNLNLRKAEDRIMQAETICSEAGLLTPSSNKEECDADKTQRSLRTLLWPFQEAVCLNAASPLLLKLLQGQNLSSSALELTLFIQALKETPSIPPALICFLETVQEESSSQELFRLMTWLFRFSKQSLAVLNTQHWVPCDLDFSNNQSQIEESLPQHCPILSRLAANLIFCHDPSNKALLTTVSLDQHGSHAGLLNSLRTLLWQSSENFSNPYYSYRENEVKTVIAAAYHFITSLEKSCCLQLSESSSLHVRVEIIIEDLQTKLRNRASTLGDFCTLLSDLTNVIRVLEESTSVENEILMQVGLAWTLLGCLESQLFSSFPKIDPSMKHAIKRQYTEEEISASSSEILAAKMVGIIKGLETNLTPSHSHLSILESHLSTLEKQLTALKLLVAVRPEPPLYSALTKEMQHFANSLCSAAVVMKLVKRLTSISKLISSSECQLIVKESQTWLLSLMRFTGMLEKRFGVWYPDIVGPLLASSSKLARGIELMAGIVKKIFLNGQTSSHHSSLTELVCSLGSFPMMNSEQPSALALISQMADPNSSSLIERILSVVGEIPDLSQRSQTESYWLLKSSVLELKNCICVAKTCRIEEWNALIKVLKSFMQIWEKQETERREREQDNESLYKSRGAVRCQTVSEEEETLHEISEMFPSERDNDFGDLEPTNTLDGRPEKALDATNLSTLSGMLTDEDIALISSVHMSLALAYTKSTWIDCSTRSTKNITTDYFTPWLQRCAVAARLISSCSHILNEDVDKCLLPSWILASYLSAPKTDIAAEEACINPDDLNFDFYRTPYVSEAKQCKPVLDKLLKRINELLCDWPEHPTLNQLLVVVNRINCFAIESPISRFLTGLEILLTKMREWEENAHSGVSLAFELTAVTNLIIQWRRLELSNWKCCLNSAALKIESRASRWWFHIFSLVETYVYPSPGKEPMSGKEIVSSLQQFIEDAPLGEFQARLDMILAFHCHLTNLPNSTQQEELQSVLWNLFCFYSQFKDIVSDRIADLKSPIEKKLKDYVKIARWNDINYWAVKETVFKTQRTLHKHIKEFEGVLKQPVKSTMVSSRLEGKSDLRKRIMPLKPEVYIANVNLKLFFGDTSAVDTSMDQSTVVYRAGSLYNRSKKLSKEIILSSSCPGLVAALDEFANDIASSVQQLASLEVDKTIPKSKQVSQAKNHLQMKRRALADLFRLLQLVGLSHHAGLTYDENLLKHEFTQLPPLDLSVYLKFLNNSTGSAVSSADKELLTAWDGSSSYFVRSWARFVQLNLALLHPHKDHGPSNIERLRGFPAHLLTLIQGQHKEIHKNANLLAQMRTHLGQLQSLQDFIAAPIPSQSNLLEWNQRLQTLLVSSCVTLQQFKLLLDACPNTEAPQAMDENIPVFVCESANSSGSFSIVKGDLVWQKAVGLVDRALLLLNECQQNTDNSKFSLYPAAFVTVDNFKKMSQCYGAVSTVMDHISEIQNLFVSDLSLHPCTRSLKWLKDRMLSECQNFSEMCKKSSVRRDTSQQKVLSVLDISDKVNTVMQNILLAIQKLYKDHTNLEEPKPDQASNIDAHVMEAETEQVEEEDFNLQEKHLSEGILKSIELDFKHLGALEISSGLKTLLDDLLAFVDMGDSSSEVEVCIRLALKLVPILHQWSLLYQFFVQQQVSAYRASCKLLSVLLAVFGDVTVKGFCTPEDLAGEVEDGEGQSDCKEGAMGLGDGEGEKDVSDRIESEDQLDDARPAGEEKKDDDKDCKEEEKGIEMSENFDGKLQDMEPKGDDEDENSEEEDDDKDAEKEMGDTEKDADQLDQQIWGSDSEEGSGDEGDGNDEEEGQSGEQTGEKEVGAREGDTNKGDKNDENTDEKGDKEENNKPEVNEMKEPEVDDDQVNPYHGDHQPEVEPEPLDLPEDLKLDDGETKENDETNEENPFDIDDMKEKMPPEQQEEDASKENEKEHDNDKSDGDTSDDDNAEPDNESAEGIDGPIPEEVEERPDDDNPQDSDERKNGLKQDDVEEDNDEGKQEDEEKNENEDRNPSKDDPTSQPTEASEENPQGSMDQVASTSQQSQETAGEQPPEEADGDPGGEEKDEVGQAPTNQEMKGHHADRSGKRPQRDQQQKKVDEEEKRQRPGHSEDQRSLGDVSEPVKKRLKTVDIKQTENEENEIMPEEEQQDETMADLYQHIKDAKEQSTTQTLDAATEEQADKQPIAVNDEEEEALPLEDDEAMDIDHEDAPLEDTGKEKKQKEENVGGSKNEKLKKEKGDLPSQNDAENDEKGIEVDGEKVNTLSAARAPETSFHTRFEDLILSNIVTVGEVEQQSEAVRRDLQNQLASWNMDHAGDEACKAWQSLSSLTNSLARDLTEQLRLVLEPTQATRMKGDFRTGRRINMRKVIPYIASQFRKDKIWMRRTKPSKREYQILLAIDDSSSMADNRSKELAFESLALVSQALTLLEVGELGVLSFGEAIKVLHKLGEPFTQHSGARLLQQFSFEQRKTQIGALVDYASVLFDTCKTQTSAEHAQLLVVISDGRGVFSEGQDKVQSCVRKARLAGIFMVFVIIDNPDNKDSILDIRTPIFNGGKLLGISSYMDSFPFPFYLILRDISNLPAVLSDALRQWFELVSNAD